MEQENNVLKTMLLRNVLLCNQAQADRTGGLSGRLFHIEFLTKSRVTMMRSPAHRSPYLDVSSLDLLHSMEKDSCSG